MLFDTMGHSLGVREGPGQSTHEALLASLTGKRMLIVLDNCEHLLEGVGDISRLLSSSPELMLLATSRAPLRLQGEQEYPLSPLPVPEMAYLPSVTDVEGVPSVQLFVDRAQAASPVFTLNQSNAAAVATICRRLDGLPLAIELAAPRTKMLSPTALLSRLDKSLPLLTGGSRDLPDRQRTMEAAIRWSYELLSLEEQALFRQLSIFAGGWTLEAAEAVGAMEDVLSPLERLVEQSLVVVAQGEDVRYRMLEPIRQYARRCLDEAQETKGTELQHSRYYTAVGEDAAQELGGASQAHWLQILETEHDNLRSTLSRLLEDGEQVEAALRLTGALWLFWHTRGYLREGRRWIESALAAAPEADARLRGRALLGAAWMAIFQGDYEAAKSQIEEALALYRSRGDAEGIASALTHLGFTAILGQRQDIPVEAALAEALELRPQLKDPRVLGNLLVFSGLVTLVAGDIPGAIQPHEEALALFREVRDTWGMKTCLTNLGLIALIRRDLASASAFLRENLELSWQTDDKLTTQYSLLGLAGVSSLVGQPTRSARLWGAAEVVREAAGIEIPPLGRAATNYDGLVACARQELGAGEFEAAWAEGRAMTARQAMEYAASED